jgi:Right handed beta helix region
MMYGCCAIPQPARRQAVCATVAARASRGFRVRSAQPESSAAATPTASTGAARALSSPCHRCGARAYSSGSVSADIATTAVPTTEGVTVRGNEISGSYQGNVMIGGYDSGRGKAAGIVVDGNRMSDGKDGQIIVQWNSTGLIFTNNQMSGRAGSKFIVTNGGRNYNVRLQGNKYLGGTGGRANGIYDDASGILLQVLQP